MEDETPYEVKINLQRMAMIRIAASFWDQPHVRNKIREFFMGESKTNKWWKYNTYNRAIWHELVTHKVLKYFSSTLPPLLRDELIYVIKELGLKIFNWYEHIERGTFPIKQDTEQLLKCLETIYWTYDGSINKVKIIEDTWIGNTSLDINIVSNMACNYVFEKNSDFWEQIPRYDYTLQQFGRCCSSEYRTCYLLSLWRNSVLEDRMCPFLVPFFNDAIWDTIRNTKLNRFNYNEAHSVDENMLRFSVYAGYNEAVKYFWNKLTEEEKDRNIDMCTASVIIMHAFHEHKDSQEHKQENRVKICIFFLKHMTIYQREELFKKKIKVSTYGDKIKLVHHFLKMLLTTWPWQEFLMLTLEEMRRLQHDEDNVSDSYCVLYEISLKMLGDYELGFPVNNSNYQILLHKVWNKIPAHWKYNILEKFHYKFHPLIWNLFYMADLSSIKLFVNSSNILEKKPLLRIQIEYKNFIANHTWEQIKQFVEDLLISEESKEYFKRQFPIGNSLYNYIITDEYHKADELINWMCSSRSIESLKAQVNKVSICEHFIEKDQYELADKFLRWIFPTENQVMYFKHLYKNAKFSFTYIRKLWARPRTDEAVEEAKQKSRNFLQWFLRSEGEIARFKRQILTLCELEDVLYCTFIANDCFEIIEDFLTWCSIDNDEIKRLKGKIVRKMTFLRQF